MSAFNDGSCAKCKGRYGWTGRAVDKPACPKCGHVPSEKEKAELEADGKVMDEMVEYLLARKEKRRQPWDDESMKENFGCDT